MKPFLSLSRWYWIQLEQWLLLAFVGSFVDKFDSNWESRWWDRSTHKNRLCEWNRFRICDMNRTTLNWSDIEMIQNIQNSQANRIMFHALPQWMRSTASCGYAFHGCQCNTKTMTNDAIEIIEESGKERDWNNKHSTILTLTPIVRRENEGESYKQVWIIERKSIVSVSITNSRWFEIVRWINR